MNVKPSLRNALAVGAGMVGTAGLALAAQAPLVVSPGAVPEPTPTVPVSLKTEVQRLSSLPSKGKTLPQLRALADETRQVGRMVSTQERGIEAHRVRQERKAKVNPVAWANPFNASVKSFKDEFVAPSLKAEREAEALLISTGWASVRFDSLADAIDPVVIEQKREEEEAHARKCRNDPDALGCMGFY
jgi:hypothetical protein